MLPQEPESGGAAPDAALQKLIKAVELHQQGELEPAEILYHEVLQAEPANPDGLHFLGLLRAHQRNPQAAVDLISRAIAIDPGNPAAYCNRGNALIDLGRCEEALRDFDQALGIQPDLVEALVNRGNALQAMGRHADALRSYEQALQLRSDYVDALRNQGIALQNLGRYAEALASYDRVLAMLPDDVPVLTSRGSILLALDRPGEAVASFDRALAIQPEHVEACNDRGIGLQKLGRYAEALDSFERTLALKPDSAEAHMHRANMLVVFRRYTEALAGYEQAIALKPDDAEVSWNKGLLKLRLGDFEEGWPLYEWRWKTRDLGQWVRQFPGPAWMGNEDLRGKTILLYGEQGLGDAIQFSRYVPQVEALGAAVILEVQPALALLMTTLSPTVAVVPQGAALPRFDFHCPIMSLPLAFGTTLATVPAKVPYLHAEPAKVSHWRETLGPKRGPRAGLAWSGTQLHHDDANRSIPLQALAPLAGAGWELHCVQKEIRPQDEPRLADCAIRPHASKLHDLAETAALLSALDLVITVDTSVAHLAGALGLPVWILLPYTPDFRWLTDREDSPWYPTARLFRQPATGDWASVIAAVSAALRARESRPQPPQGDPPPPDSGGR